MKAKIHGIEVEGTMDEILKMKDILDKREELKNMKVLHVHIEKSNEYVNANEIANTISLAIKKYSNC